MRKGANLQAQVNVGTAPGAADQLEAKLPSAFEKVNPGTTLKVRKLTPPDEHGNAKLRIYVEGDQDPAADFSAFIMTALQKAIATMPGVTIRHAGETEDAEDDSEVLLSPKAQAAAAALSGQNQPTGQAASAQNQAAEAPSSQSPAPAGPPPQSGAVPPPPAASALAPDEVATPAEEQPGSGAGEENEPFWKRLFGRS